MASVSLEQPQVWHISGYLDFLDLDGTCQITRRKRNLHYVVDELLLSMYPDLDEQEFQVLKTVVWVMWDLSSGCNFAYYNALVSYLIGPENENRRDLFATIKDVEDTIMRLVHKGIISQYIDFTRDVDNDGNTTWRYDDPFISLSFPKDSDSGEMIAAIGEVFSHEIRAFIGPHTDYDVQSESRE